MAYQIHILGTLLNIHADIPQETLDRVVKIVEQEALELYELTQETNRAALFLLVALNLALELDELRTDTREINRVALDLVKEIQHALREDHRTPILHRPEERET